MNFSPNIIDFINRVFHKKLQLFFQNAKPQPYHFGYRTKGEHGTQFRNEKSDGKGQVRGSYGYTDPAGTYREVTYVADHNGFRAEIKTNEHGTSDLDPANVEIKSAARQVFGDIKRLVAKQKVPSSEMVKKTPGQKYAKYSDVRFFHFGGHSHEEKRGSDDEDGSEENEDRGKSEEEEEETKTSGEQEGNSGDEESGVEERTMFHRIGRHGGHE